MQKYIATKELKRGGGIQQAIECSGLPKEAVISLNRELLRKNEEARRKKEENDDGEEPRRRN